MPFERDFYAFIRAYYRTRGISVRELGRRIGRGERQTYRIINMERQITVKDMEDIMDKLGYDLGFEPREKPTDQGGEGV